MVKKKNWRKLLVGVFIVVIAVFVNFNKATVKLISFFSEINFGKFLGEVIIFFEMNLLEIITILIIIIIIIILLILIRDQGGKKMLDLDRDERKREIVEKIQSGEATSKEVEEYRKILGEEYEESREHSDDDHSFLNRPLGFGLGGDEEESAPGDTPPSNGLPPFDLHADEAGETSPPDEGNSRIPAEQPPREEELLSFLQRSLFDREEPSQPPLHPREEEQPWSPRPFGGREDEPPQPSPQEEELPSFLQSGEEEKADESEPESPQPPPSQPLQEEAHEPPSFFLRWPFDRESGEEEVDKFEARLGAGLGDEEESLPAGEEPAHFSFKDSIRDLVTFWKKGKMEKAAIVLVAIVLLLGMYLLFRDITGRRYYEPVKPSNRAEEGAQTDFPSRRLIEEQRNISKIAQANIYLDSAAKAIDKNRLNEAGEFLEDAYQTFKNLEPGVMLEVENRYYELSGKLTSKRVKMRSEQ